MGLKHRIFLDAVLKAAIAEVNSKNIDVFTFAFYHDHESGAVSVCVDTRKNSDRVVSEINAYNLKYFQKAVAAGDLETAGLWGANIGRSLSLGDFSMVNLARTDIGQRETTSHFYLAMLQALLAVQTEVALLTVNPEHLLFACSSEKNEVEYLWSLPK